MSNWRYGFCSHGETLGGCHYVLETSETSRGRPSSRKSVSIDLTHPAEGLLEPNYSHMVTDRPSSSRGSRQALKKKSYKKLES